MHFTRRFPRLTRRVSLRLVAVFTVFILVLLVRPEGLAGTAVGRRV